MYIETKIKEAKMHNTRIDIGEEARVSLCQLLNERLADSLVMSLNAKHAHWNVKGANFIALHELFDKIAEMHTEHADDVAERITALGGTANGVVSSLNKCNLKDYPVDAFAGHSQVTALADKMAVYAKSVREASRAADELGDEDTADLFTGISRDVDKNLWFLEAHLQA